MSHYPDYYTSLTPDIYSFLSWFVCIDVIITTALEGNKETATLARTHGHMDGLGRFTSGPTRQEVLI